MSKIPVPEMIEIVDEGPFLIGDEHGLPEQKPEQFLELSTYRIGKYPVTNKEYAAFIKSSGYPPPVSKEDWAKNYCWKNSQPLPDRHKHPVVLVSYYDALAYCEWLNVMTQRPKGFFYRLPTEAEWEKAASWGIGKVMEKRRRFPWGDKWDPLRCNCYVRLSGKATVFDDIGDWVRWWDKMKEDANVDDYHLDAVDKYPGGASRYNVCDLAGNTWEWCLDSWSSYAYHEIRSKDHCRTSPDILHVTRGGGWPYHPSKLWVTYRGNPLPPSFKGNRVGFRVVLAKTHKLLPTSVQDSFLDEFGSVYRRQKFNKDIDDGFGLPSSAALSIIFADLDKFKNINDTYGHLVGDEVLRKFFQLVAAIVGQGNESLFKRGIAYRFGGEETVIVMPNTAICEAKSTAERINTEWAKIIHQCKHSGNIQEFKNTVSIGVACRSDASQSLKSILNYADKAAYTSKENGRNQVTVIESK